MKGWTILVENLQTSFWIDLELGSYCIMSRKYQGTVFSECPELCIDLNFIWIIFYVALKQKKTILITSVAVIISKQHDACLAQYNKTCVNWPLKNRQNKDLNAKW